MSSDFLLPVGDRYQLRSIQIADAEELFALTDANRSYLRQWLPWLDVVTQVEHTRDFIAREMQQFAEQKGLAAAIYDGGRIIGMVGFNRLEQQDRIGYIGYWLAQSDRGKGIMTEACRSLINYGFTKLKLNRVVITCATENHRSRAIPLRLGFTKEGVIRDAEWLYHEFVEHDIYALAAEDWQKSATLSQRGYPNALLSNKSCSNPD
ncbi:GNAT family protein [Chamaesiphon sp. OTE_75_metabat_556]|uniref:GNAT family N-acetyltransferase n=1 Tax=Chamaesiphon sp. OTE_75_metabat_556 TaxID=2964692 RepID=UPI00286B7832|nr:GNAT family protein [Chamaesiphon sp. OTE_75_metabat_556]